MCYNGFGNSVGTEREPARCERAAMKNSESRYQHLTHDAFGPLYDEDSAVLILGSFPSVKSREAAFYYGHKQNRFWPLMAQLFGAEEVPVNKEDKAAFILSRHLALWDVIESCDIIGSSDASIRNAVVTDVASLIAKTRIREIFINGTTAYRLFVKYQSKELVQMAEKLPSTSPANAAWSLERLKEEWKKVPEAVEAVCGK